MLDDFLAALFGDFAIDSLRGTWVARIVVALAVLAVIGVLVILVS